MTRTLTPRLDGRNAAVVGAGSSGRAAAMLLCALGAAVRVLERDATRLSPEFRAFAESRGVEIVFGEHKPEHFEALDLVVMSPGVPVVKIKPFLSSSNAPEVVAELELASRYIAAPVLAITGTNGKTTTATLMARMLEQSGKKVFLGGNIGTPLAEFVLNDMDADVLVLEVSSFQLQTCNSFAPKVAVLLNFSANHLDYHADMDEYLHAKLNLFSRQKLTDLAIFPEELRELVAKYRPTAARLHFFASQGRFTPGKLVGAHNQTNMEAAYQACAEFGVTEAQAQAAVDAFAPLAHRLTPVAEKHQVLYVDDSKATTIEAMAAALASFDRPIRLLAGGIYKGGNLESVLPLLQRKVRSVGLFGGSREVFEAAWEGKVDLFWTDTLEEAVRRHAAQAAPGDVVLLAPATSSFDQYADYKARGDDFARIVGELE